MNGLLLPDCGCQHFLNDDSNPGLEFEGASQRLLLGAPQALH